MCFVEKINKIIYFAEEAKAAQEANAAEEAKAAQDAKEAQEAQEAKEKAAEGLLQYEMHFALKIINVFFRNRKGS